MGSKSKTDKFATKYPGVYKKYSTNRRNPKDGKPDEGFTITVRFIENGKYVKKWLYLGWKTNGMTADKANDILLAIKRQIKTGEAPRDIFERVQNGGDIEKDPNTKAKQVKAMLTFGEAWDIYHEKWLPNLARPQDEISKYKNHLQPRFEHVPLDKIKSLDLETLKHDLFSAGLSPATVKHALSLFGRVYNKMVTWDYYDGPLPAANLKMPKVDNGRVRYLTTDEADKLMTALKDRSPFWWRIAMLSLHTGMRIGEVLDLTWTDVDFHGNVIYVRRGKTGSRMVQMNEVASAVLKDAPIHPDSDLVFPQRNGGPILTSTASHLFSFVVKELNLNPKGTPTSQKVVFHTLRHTFASWLVMSGVPLYTVSNLLGHASLAMTYRYAHLAPDTQKEAVNLLATLTRGKTAGSISDLKAA